MLKNAKDAVPWGRGHAEFPAALGPWSGNVIRKASSVKLHPYAALDALGCRAPKACHVIFVDVVRWPGAAKQMEWVCAILHWANEAQNHPKYTNIPWIHG